MATGIARITKAGKLHKRDTANIIRLFESRDKSSSDAMITAENVECAVQKFDEGYTRVRVYADMRFFPNNYRWPVPIQWIEIKWGRSTDTATFTLGLGDARRYYGEAPHVVAVGTRNYNDNGEN